jgi:hypothetical protein
MSALSSVKKDNNNNNKKAQENRPYVDTFSTIPEDYLVPQLTSFIAHQGSQIATRINGGIQTEDGSRQLAKDQDKDIKKVYGPLVSSQFKDLYYYTDKVMQHECWREDGTVAACIDYLVQFILGKHFKTIIDVNEEFEDEDIKKQALEAFTKSDKLVNYKKVIDKVNKKTNITEFLRGLLTQAFVFGRGAFLIERDPNTLLPTFIKPLPSMSLGRVFVHSKTWEVLGLEWLDMQFPESLLKAEDIFYMPIRNYHVSPGSYWYGYSLIERVIHLSMLNRMTNQRNLKEANFRMWAGFIVLEIVGSMSKQTLDQLKEDIAKGAGNVIATNQNAKLLPEKIPIDLNSLIQERDSNDKEIVHQLQVPQLLFDPDIINRATGDAILKAWQESVLECYRVWLTDVIQKQWLDPMIKVLIENADRPLSEVEAAVDEIEQQVKQSKQNGPQPLDQQTAAAQATIKTANTPLPFSNPIVEAQQKLQQQKAQQQIQAQKQKQQLQEAQQPLWDKLIDIVPRDPITNQIMVDQLPWKIKVEFENINFSTDADIAKEAVTLFGPGIISKEKALEMMGMEDEIEKAQLEDQTKQMENGLKMQAMASQVNGNAQQQQQQPGKPGAPFGGGNKNKNLSNQKPGEAPPQPKAASELLELDYDPEKIIEEEFVKAIKKISGSEEGSSD